MSRHVSKTENKVWVKKLHCVSGMLFGEFFSCPTCLGKLDEESLAALGCLNITLILIKVC